MVDMNLSSPVVLRPIAPALLLGLALGGCLTGKSTIGLLDEDDASSGTPSEGSETSGGEASGGETDGGTTSTTNGNLDASDGEPPTTGEPPLACPPTSQCSVPLECAPEGFEECGGILGRSDENGCPRQPCSGPGQCPAGASCYLPRSWRTCGYHGCEDNPETGACECGFGLDCNDNGLCVPDEEGLPPDTNGTDFCGAMTDPLACENSGLPAELGACRWYEGWELPEDAACEERVATGRCTFSAASLLDPGPLPPCAGDDDRTPMAYVDAGLVTVLFIDPEDPPTALDHEYDIDTYGWLTCDQPEVAAECACACG